MTPLVAFHGKEETKQFYVARVQGPYDADEIVKGIGVLWEGGRGSAVGCTLHGRGYEYYETELGIPQVLGRVEDVIFSGLPKGDPRKLWPLRFLKAIRPGQDLSLVGWKFFHWLQTNDLETAKENKVRAEVIAALKQCADVLVPLTEGRPVDQSGAKSALRSGARAAKMVRAKNEFPAVTLAASVPKAGKWPGVAEWALEAATRAGGWGVRGELCEDGRQANRTHRGCVKRRSVLWIG
jgi:hypothetical protein